MTDQNQEIIRERLRHIRDMMGTVGWADMLKDWQNDIESLERDCIFNVKNYESLMFNRGALSVLNRLTNLDKIVDATENSLLAPEASAED